MSSVLIFDDDTDILELCSIILKTKGYKTTFETTCTNVIEKVKAADPDVILMDNWIPDTGGVVATQLIKSNPATSHIPVVFFSASNNVEEFSKKAKADYVLQKPFDIADLDSIIAKAIKSRQVAE